MKKGLSLYKWKILCFIFAGIAVICLAHSYTLSTQRQTATQDDNVIYSDEQHDTIPAQTDTLSGSADLNKLYYWVPKSDVYHITKNCSTLSNSRNIRSGYQPPSDRRPCKVCA